MLLALRPFDYLGDSTSPTYTLPAVSGSPSSSDSEVSKPRWRLRIVGLDYAAKGEFTTLSELEWTENLNGFDELTFTVSLDDAVISKFYVWQRWIECWLDGDIKFRGFPVLAEPDLLYRNVEITCFDQLYPFSFRVFGRADRVNYVTNGGFESGTTGWSAVGPTMTSETVAPINEGVKSLELTGSGYVMQTFSVRHTYPPGLALRVAFDVHLQSAASLPVEDATIVQTILTDPDDGATYAEGVQLDPDLRDEWQSLYFDHLVSRHNTTYLVEIRLFSPATGYVWFDNVRVVFNQAVTLAYPGEDQARMFRNIVQYGQDANEGKSTLGISTNCVDTGVIIFPSYLHGDHRPLMSAIDELTARPDGPDWDLVFTTKGCTFTTYYPSKGSTKPGALIEVGRNVIEGRVLLDGQQTYTSAIVVGDTGDFERDEGGYVDTSGLSGVVLEDVILADAGMSPQFFDQIAEEHVTRRKGLVKNPRLLVADPTRAYIHGGIETGDIIPLRWDTGLVQLDGTANYRVLKRTVYAAADALYLELEEVPA